MGVSNICAFWRGTILRFFHILSISIHTIIIIYTCIIYIYMHTHTLHILLKEVNWLNWRSRELWNTPPRLTSRNCVRIFSWSFPRRTPSHHPILVGFTNFPWHQPSSYGVSLWLWKPPPQTTAEAPKLWWIRQISGKSRSAAQSWQRFFEQNSCLQPQQRMMPMMPKKD